MNGSPENVYATASQAIVDLAYAHYNRDPTDARFFASNNLAVPAEPFRGLGGFDPAFRTAEDRELCDRWVSSGRRMSYVPDAVVRHVPALTLARFARQHFGYGRGAHRFHALRARRGGGRFRPELQFYAAVLRHPLRQRGPRAVLTSAASLAVAEAANAAGFGWEAVRERAGRLPGRARPEGT